MKTKLTLLAFIMVLLHGCTTSRYTPPAEKSSRGKIVGMYEHRQGGVIYRRIFLENGIMEYLVNGEKVHESKWAESATHFVGYTSPIQIVLTTVDNSVATEFLVIESNGDLTWIASSKEGRWHEMKSPRTYRKIQ